MSQNGAPELVGASRGEMQIETPVKSSSMETALITHLATDQISPRNDGNSMASINFLRC
jgi:hypothetical protein